MDVQKTPKLIASFPASSSRTISLMAKSSFLSESQEREK